MPHHCPGPLWMRLALPSLRARLKGRHGMNHCQPYPGTQLCLPLSLWVRVIYATGRELNGVQESGSEGWGAF